MSEHFRNSSNRINILAFSCKKEICNRFVKMYRNFLENYSTSLDILTLYMKGLPPRQPGMRYKLMRGAPTLTIPLLISKFFCPFHYKSKGEEYRIGNVGDLYFFTFWWIQWFAMLVFDFDTGV